MTTLTDPATGGFEITPSDSADVAHTTRAIRCAGAGNLVVTCADGASMTYRFLAGETRAIRVKRVFSTNTTATGIEGMY